MSKKPVLKIDFPCFTPNTRTPWAGSQISEWKSKYSDVKTAYPNRIGESWEISTDPAFVSSLMHNGKRQSLIEVLAQEGHAILGPQMKDPHCPLLLKWLHTQNELSVQLHPSDDNPLLGPQECGKPESWLVLDIAPKGLVYLGFKEGYSQKEIQKHFENGTIESCLYSFKPRKYDFISIPTGCVHAVGAGVLLVEPQLVLPFKSGKTWRLFDWNRKYDALGNYTQESHGMPRELHTVEAMEAIDWSLPRGRHLEKILVSPLPPDFQHGRLSYPRTKHNQFPMELFVGAMETLVRKNPHQGARALTIWSGELTVVDLQTGESSTLRGGESGIIPADSPSELLFSLKFHREDPACALFDICFF